MRRGSISTAVSAILTMAALIIMLGLILTTYRNELSSYTVLVNRGQEVLEKASTNVRAAIIEGKGLTLLINKPPVRVVGVLAVYPDGSVRRIRNDMPTVVKGSSVTLLPMETVRELASKGCKVLVILGNGNYLVSDLNLSLNLINTNKSVSELKLSNEVNNIINLTPYMIGGEAINPASFMNDPIPGNPGDLGANFIPEVTIKLKRQSLGNVAGFLKLLYSKEDYSYSIYLSNPSEHEKGSRYAFLILVPVIFQKGIKPDSVNIAFHLYVRPINNYGSGGNNFFLLKVLIRPVWFAVLPIDYWRTPLVTIPSNVMFLSQNQYSVAKSLAYWQGELINKTLKAYYLNVGTTKHAFNVLDKYVIIHVSKDEIFSKLPANLSSVVVLAGIQMAINYCWSAYPGVYSVVNPFSLIRLWIYNVSSISVRVSNDMVGKPVIIQLPMQGFAISVHNPYGRQVDLFKPLNVKSSFSKYGLAYFIPKETGTYRVSFIVNASTRFNGSYNISLTSVAKPSLLRLRGPVSNLSKSSSSTQLIELSDKGGYLKANYTLIYRFISNLNSPVSMVFTGVNKNSTYLILGSDVNHNCRTTGTPTWYPVTRYLSTCLLDYSSWVRACMCSVGVKASFKSPDKFSVTFTLWWQEDFSEEFLTVGVANHDELSLSSEAVGNSLILYYAGNNVVLSAVPGVINHLLDVK